VNLAHKGEIPMTNFAKFVETLENNFAVDIIVGRREMNNSYGVLEIREAGETVAIFDFEEDFWGEGDEYDESYLRTSYISSSISTDLLQFLDQHPVTEGVYKEWKEDLKMKFMLKGWHVK
jgi:hypothetical protein